MYPGYASSLAQPSCHCSRGTGAANVDKGVPDSALARVLIRVKINESSCCADGALGLERGGRGGGRRAERKAMGLGFGVGGETVVAGGTRWRRRWRLLALLCGHHSTTNALV